MINLYLLGGQSNMDGRASKRELSAELRRPDSNIPVYVNGGWHDLQPGLNHDCNSEWFGPEITFGPEMVVSTNQNIALAKYAVGSTTLFNEWHVPDGERQRGGSCYSEFMKTVKEAIGSIGADTQVSIRGMIWMQGETDAWLEGPAASLAYEQNLTNFIHRVRNEFHVPKMPFVLGRISPSWNWSGGGHGEIVRQAQVNVSQNDSDVLMIDTDDLTLESDEAHYSASGQMILGRRFAQAMISLLVLD